MKIGARHPCTALLGQRDRKPNARNVIAYTNNMARHRALWRAMASASAKMLRRLCYWVGQTCSLEAQRLRMRRHRLCRRQAVLHGASGAPRPHTELPERHSATNYHLTQWRVTELYGAMAAALAKMPQRLVFWGFLVLSVGPVQIS